MLRPGAPFSKLAKLAISGPVLVCLVGALLVWRFHEDLFYPKLRAEDGAKVFAYFYGHRGISELFRFKAGYIPLLPNVFGFVSVRLPARATPYFLTCAPTVLAMVTFSVLRASAYRRYLPRDGLRFVCCCALASMPIGSHFMACNSDYSIWNALLLLLLVVILPMPGSMAGATVFSLVVATLIWSHPLTILALPATLYWLWYERSWRQRSWHALLAACQALHVWLGTQPHKAVIVKGHAPIGDRIAEQLTIISNHLCHGVIRPTIFPWGPESAAFDLAISAIFLLALVACAVVLKHRIAARVLYLWFAYGVVAPMVLISLVRPERGLQSTRYYYVSKAFTVIALALLLAQISFSALRRWAARSERLEAFPSAASLLLVAYLNYGNGGFAGDRISDPENARIVAKFFSELASAEAAQGGHCNIKLRCQKKHGDWPFEVDTRDNCN